jgi:hypothetical protein
MQKRMTVSELKYQVQATGSHWFDRKTMKFFGDTMRNFGCSSKPFAMTDNMGRDRMVYQLWRKGKVKEGNLNSAWFDAETFKQVWPAR